MCRVKFQVSRAMLAAAPGQPELWLTGAAMDKTSFDVLGDTLGNRRQDVVEPSPGRVFPLVFFIGLLGIFMLVSLRRVLIIDFRLPWPSSTATGEPPSNLEHMLQSQSPWPVLLTVLCMPASLVLLPVLRMPVFCAASNHAAACLHLSLLGSCCCCLQETCMAFLTATFLPSAA